MLSTRPLRPQTPLTSSEQENSRKEQSHTPEVEKPRIPSHHSSVDLSGPCLPSTEPALTRGAPMSPGLKGKRCGCASSSELGVGLQGCWSRGPVKHLRVNFGFDDQEIWISLSCWFPMETYLEWHRRCGHILTTSGQRRDYYLLPVGMKTVTLEGVRPQPISK